jgi:uncharacterized protein (DUF302 family)
MKVKALNTALTTALTLACATLITGCAAPAGSNSQVVSSSSGSPEGLITLISPRSAKDTMDKLEASVREKGFGVVARVDHAAAATRVNKTLRPTELLIFGNPAGGTPLMECAQTIGIELPIKALVWSDAEGKVMLSYNDPAYLAKRHNAPECAAAMNMGKALDGIMKAVVAP